MTLPIVPRRRDQQSWTEPRAILGGRYRASRKSGSGMQNQRYSWLTQRLFAGRPLKRHAPSGQAEEPKEALLSGATSVPGRPFLTCDISTCPFDTDHSILRPQTNSPNTAIVSGTLSATRSAASSCQSPAASGDGLRTPPDAKTFRMRRRTAAGDGTEEPTAALWPLGPAPICSRGRIDSGFETLSRNDQGVVGASKADEQSGSRRHDQFPRRTPCYRAGRRPRRGRRGSTSLRSSGNRLSRRRPIPGQRTVARLASGRVCLDGYCWLIRARKSPARLCRRG
ncbi:hypothetical protein ABIE45_003922 [Methylobacterium sp. OAE515]